MSTHSVANLNCKSKITVDLAVSSNLEQIKRELSILCYYLP
jgi:hypothetical protein